MRLADVRLDESEGVVRLSAVAEDASGKALPEVWFEYDARWRDFVRADADVFLPMMFVGSMLRGERFETGMPVSVRMCAELRDVSAIFGKWFGERLTATVPEISNVEAKPADATGNTATFFSAGVDAFYVALKFLRGEGDGSLTHLVYMRGLEAPLSKIKSGKESRIEAIARDLGLPVIMGKTNLRDCFDYDYLPYVCGPALASSALSLSRRLSRMRIPSGASYRVEDFYPESTHLLLDRLWSTEYMEIRSDGAEKTRAHKTQYISSSETALGNLAVCIVNLGEWDNCCRCPKCVRTMISLQALGVLEKAAGFCSPFDYGLIGGINLDSPLTRAFFVQNLELSHETGHDARLTREMEKHLARWKKYRALVTLVEGTPFHGIARWAREAVKKRRKAKA